MLKPHWQRESPRSRPPALPSPNQMMVRRRETIVMQGQHDDAVERGFVLLQAIAAEAALGDLESPLTATC